MLAAFSASATARTSAAVVVELVRNAANDS
jgi:hypothetical protein